MKDKTEKQEPFLIDMTYPTSEMLGRHILGKLETTQAWVVPIYDGKPNVAALLEPPVTEDLELLSDKDKLEVQQLYELQVMKYEQGIIADYPDYGNIRDSYIAAKQKAADDKRYGVKNG